ERKGVISHPKLPLEIRIDDYFENSTILGPFQAKQMGQKVDARATAGAGVGVTVVSSPRVAGTESKRIDMPSAYVTLTGNGGQSLGTYLLTTLTNQPEAIDLNGRVYRLQLRFKRMYKP